MTEQTGPGPDQPPDGQPQGGYPPQPGPSAGQPPQPGPSAGQPPPTGPPAGPPPQPPTAPYGGAPAPLRPDEERLWAALAHWGGLVLGLLAPLLVYVIFKDRSRWVAETSREALNFQISYTIYLLVAGVSMILLVGFVLFPIVLVTYYVFLLIGAIKVLGNQLYRFPLILRLVG